MKRKVEFVEFQNAISVPSVLTGFKTLNPGRDIGIEMSVGVDPGFLTVCYKGREVLIPVANIKSLLVMCEDKDGKGK